MARAPWPVVLLLVATGCANAEDSDRAGTSPDVTASPTSESPSPGEPPRSPAGATAPGTVVTVGDSPFGRMLFDRRGQAIYLFEPESDGTPACYGECEEAWPPVLTEGPPRAGADVDADLLGTVRRRDGAHQVTYRGQPLYFYAHEGPGEVLCHDVVLNGGLWLAIGPDGRALPA